MFPLVDVGIYKASLSQLVTILLFEKTQMTPVYGIDEAEQIPILEL